MKFNNLLDGFFKSGVSSGLASGLVGGLAGSLLTSKTGRKIGKNALKLGGAAAVGAIAYGAYKKYSANQVKKDNFESNKKSNLGVRADELSFFPEEDDIESIHKLELVLVKAMIAASRADGLIEVEETQKIFKQIRSFNLEEDEFKLMSQINQPTNIDELIESASSIELATEIYTVSCLVIEEANEAEREYLAILADKLKLPNELVNAIEIEVNAQKHRLAA